MKIVQHLIETRTEARQRTNVVHCGRGIYLSVYFIIKLCLFVYKTENP